jgi:hypothetical protein
MRIAVATSAAWLWSPLWLLGQTSIAYDSSPVISTTLTPAARIRR